jgi:small-conductance mechanosensitive channel
MDFEVISKKFELGFFTSDPYQAFLNASLPYFITQLLVCLTAYLAIHYVCRQVARIYLLKPVSQTLISRFVVSVLPHVAFAVIGYTVIQNTSAANDPTQLLLSKELLAVAGLVGVVKFCMWVLRDVMQPHNFLNFLLGLTEWALLVVIALSSVGLYTAVIEAIASIQITVGDLVLKGGNIVGGSVFAVVAYTVAGQTARLVDIALERYGQNRGVAPNDLMVIGRAFRILIFTVVSMSVLMSLGINGTQLVAFAGALGIGLGFGLQEVAVNLISGLYILFEGSLKIGDYVTVNGVSGRVTDLNSRSTVIEDEDGVRNLIPNSLITKEVLKSHPLNSDSYRFTFPVTLHKVDDFVEAKALILNELKKHSHILDDKPQEVFVKSVNENSTKLEVSCWLNNVNRNPRQLLSDLYFGIAMALNAQHIKFSCNDELDVSGEEA